MASTGIENALTTQQQLSWQLLAQPQNQLRQSEKTDLFGSKQVEAKTKSSEPDWQPSFQMVDVTTVSIMPEEVEGPKTINFFGFKIDLGSKIGELKESYMKNYALTKSHNLMVARFAELKASAIGVVLTTLGVASDELENLQKKSVRDAAKQNKLLFEENEYNNELTSMLGASRKKMRAQNKLMGEIRNQLLIQAKNLGLGEYYTKERILEIRLEQCQKILGKFLEERMNLEYQTKFIAFGAN